MRVSPKAIVGEYSLNADAELNIGELVDGVGVEIVRRAAVELIPLANLASDDQPQGNRSQRRRDPADSLQQAGRFRRRRRLRH